MSRAEVRLGPSQKKGDPLAEGIAFQSPITTVESAKLALHRYQTPGVITTWRTRPQAYNDLRCVGSRRKADEPKQSCEARIGVQVIPSRIELEPNQPMRALLISFI